MRHIKRTWRTAVSENESVHWVQDEVYLSRLEGGRSVSRRTEIFDLETSNRIMLNYHKNVPSDYKLILGRFAELLKQSKESRIQMIKANLRNSNSFVGYIGNCASNQIEMLEIIAGFHGLKKEERKRTILDYRCGIFKLVKEEDNNGKDNCLPRPLYSLASEIRGLKKRFC